MNRYMFLTYGFEMPTPEIMEAWNKWFSSFKEKMQAQGGFIKGREITGDGVKDLPMDRDAITGYVIINAQDIDQAEKIARDCPMISGTRVYEIREG